MGIGWVQVVNSSIIHSFNAQIKLWPCSFKAELTAILSAITTAPRNSTLNIFTDSQSVISKYYSITYTQPPVLNNHTPYFSLWHTLIYFTQSYNIKLIFHKVTAHQNNSFNNSADQLARNHQSTPYLTFLPNNIYNPYYTPYYSNYPIELPLRRCIRTICHAHIIATWSSQNRLQQWTEIFSQIHWQASWLYINNNQKPSNFSHSFQSSTLKSFRVKILLDELPTPHTLNRRNSIISPLCHFCHQTSSHLHWINCPTTEPIHNLITQSLQTILNSSTLNTSHQTTLQIHQQIYNLDCLNLHNFSNKPSLLTTLSGLIPYELIYTLKNTPVSQNIATTLSIKLLLYLN